MLNYMQLCPDENAFLGCRFKESLQHCEGCLQGSKCGKWNELYAVHYLASLLYFNVVYPFPFLWLAD